MFAPTRGFSGMADSMEPCKMLCANPCCHGNDIWARRGDLVAYKLVTIIVVCYYVMVNSDYKNTIFYNIFVRCL